jgi:kynurenine formamidase
MTMTINYVDDGNPLHTLDLYNTPLDNLWVIFIHGGAWLVIFLLSDWYRRDPRQTSRDGDPLLKHLLKTDLSVTLASLNYRLSPHVRHPSHQEDIIAALEFLKRRYGMKEYLLVGHSAGACLAFQASHISGCKGVTGVEGIYDLEDLVEEYPEYEEFVEEAFGKDTSVWQKASPTHLDFSALTVKLVQSTEDQLLSPRQTQLMFSKLKNTNVKLEEIAWIKGTHDSSITTPEFCSLVYALIAQSLIS